MGIRLEINLWINNLHFMFSYSNFLELTCSVLYDTMRPLIIHIKHMETLTEFCTIIRGEILQEHVQNNGELNSFNVAAFTFG